MKVLCPLSDGVVSGASLATSLQSAKSLVLVESDSLERKLLGEEVLHVDIRLFVSFIREQGVTAMIIPKIRPLALQIISQYGMTVYEPKGESVEENLALFCQGDLEPYSMSSSRELLTCDSGSCSSCSSTTCSN